MFMYAIVLSAPNQDVAARVSTAYPQHYQLNPSTFLVRSPKISESVAVEAGLKGDNRVGPALGAVFKLNGAYSGFAASALWEWLKAEE